MVRQEVTQRPPARLKQVVTAVGWPTSSFFRQPKATKKRPGPAPKPLDPQRAEAVCQVALAYPWWGYKRIAVICRRQGLAVSNRFVYRVLKEAGLLQRRRPRSPELYQAARLFELLPRGPNELWQADVTYIHIPGCGWWYAATVIDYFSRYLLALHLSPSNDAAALTVAVDQAFDEAERVHGTLERTPILVTDNGSNFLARRFREHIEGRLCQVRTQYRTPQQLGLLERFHQTLKQEEVYWEIYRSPAEARDRLAAFRERYNEIRPHWALRPTEGVDPVTPADVYCRGVKVQIPAWQQWAKEAKAKLEAMLEEDAEAA
jgi:transposase InsO family protein